MNEQPIPIGVAQDCFVKCVAPFLLAVCYFKSERCFGDAIDFRSKVPPFIMKESFAIGEEELQVTYLRSVNCGIVDFGYTTGVERLPHSARGGIGRTDGEFGTVRPARLKARSSCRAPWESMLHHCMV
jgi:hypothetical protein